MPAVDLAALIEDLRTRGGERPDVEVKTAAGGLPASLTETMCALANLPGGGIVILGLEERRGFAPVTLKDPGALAAGIASRARQAFAPEIQVSTDVERFEGKRIVVARIHELPPAGKPCVVRRTGVAYLRFADGDYPLSRLEMDAFITNRGRPRFDEAAVVGATRGDLDEERVADFVSTARTQDRRLARFGPDELLVRMGVVTADEVPTVAGLLALGVYPQQQLPHCNLRAAVLPEPADPTVRALDSATFTGPISAMLDEAIAWVARNSRRRLVSNPGSGAVRTELDPPATAVRELVANALVHRDLAEWASSRAVELRMSAGSLRLTNPGGLFGVTADRLGVHPLTSARNRRLVEICKFVRTDDGNVVEALASGIPATLAALRSAGLPGPRFFDQGIAFTVVLDGGTVDREAAVGVLAASPPTASEASMATLAALDHPMTIGELSQALGIGRSATQKRVAQLRAAGLVEARGGRGQHTTYLRR